MTEFDFRKKDEYIVKYMSFSFEQKVKHLNAFIEEQLNELKTIWDKLKNEMGMLNRERRFLAHGFMQYSLPKESITTYIRENGQITTKKHSVEEIEVLTDRLHHLNTGENGINGEFHTLFTKTRIDKWNNLVNDENKILYRVNSEIISEWKGSGKSD